MTIFKIQSFQFWIGISVLSLIILFISFSSLIIKYDPNVQNDPAQNRLQKPNWKFWFGTDKFGRDIFSRVLYGGRISLFIAVSVVLFSVIIGSLYGAISGYFGGLIDQILMRFVDLLLSFPIIFLAITCMALFGAGHVMLIFVLTLTSWMDVARLVRAEVHSLKQRPFILKAKAVGLKTSRIISKHLMPNVLLTVFTFSIIRTADIILIESALSFIGIGTQPPTASWGSMICDGRSYLPFVWWITFFPGIAILCTTMSLNFIGHGLKTTHE
jgi:peptide/nickel transport system permease protein